METITENIENKIDILEQCVLDEIDSIILSNEENKLSENDKINKQMLKRIEIIPFNSVELHNAKTNAEELSEMIETVKTISSELPFFNNENKNNIFNQELPNTNIFIEINNNTFLEIKDKDITHLIKEHKEEPIISLVNENEKSIIDKELLPLVNENNNELDICGYHQKGECSGFHPGDSDDEDNLDDTFEKELPSLIKEEFVIIPSLDENIKREEAFNEMIEDDVFKIQMEEINNASLLDKQNEDAFNIQIAELAFDEDYNVAEKEQRKEKQTFDQINQDRIIAQKLNGTYVEPKVSQPQTQPIKSLEYNKEQYVKSPPQIQSTSTQSISKPTPPQIQPTPTPIQKCQPLATPQVKKEEPSMFTSFTNSFASLFTHSEKPKDTSTTTTTNTPLIPKQIPIEREFSINNSDILETKSNVLDLNGQPLILKQVYPPPPISYSQAVSSNPPQNPPLKTNLNPNVSSFVPKQTLNPNVASFVPNSQVNNNLRHRNTVCNECGSFLHTTENHKK
jgi:hypothetical protein